LVNLYLSEGTVMKLTQADIDAMPMEEKLELSEALWASIHTTADELPIPDWHKQLLDERFKDPTPQLDSWENVKKRLERS